MVKDNFLSPQFQNLTHHQCTHLPPPRPPVSSFQPQLLQPQFFMSVPIVLPLVLCWTLICIFMFHVWERSFCICLFFPWRTLLSMFYCSSSHVVENCMIFFCLRAREYFIVYIGHISTTSWSIHSQWGIWVVSLSWLLY